MVTETRTLARLDVISVAKTIGLALGFVAGLVFTVMAITGVGPFQYDATRALGRRLLVGAFMIVSGPFVYGAIGFVAGALLAAIYNKTVRWTGGLRFDLRGSASASAAVESENERFSAS